MEEFYIKENDRWSGPFVEGEFRIKIAGKKEVAFWKPEFCPNHILHPSLCSHHQIMKGQEKTEDIPEIQQQEPVSELKPVEESKDTVAKTETTVTEAPVPEPKEIIQGPPPAIATDTPEIPVKGTSSTPETALKTPQEKPPEIYAPQKAGDDNKSGIYTKLTVIIIGFLLVILAGFYVNSRLSVMKYQDKIIRNYIEDVNAKTETILKQQKILEQKMDSLNLLLSKKMSKSKESKNNFPAGTNRDNINK